MDKLSLLYASALFSIAIEKDVVGDFMDQASLLRDSLRDPECQRVLVHPHITSAEKQEFFKKAFSGAIHEDLMAFLFLTTDKNRETFIVPALTALTDMIDRHMKRVTADVYSASGLDDKQVSSMKEILSDKLGKTVEVSLNIDPTVIGGPYIYVDGYYIDWTVKKRLRDLTVHMKEGCSV